MALHNKHRTPYADAVRERAIKAMSLVIFERAGSAKAFAQKIGTSPAAVSKWKSGGAFPTLDNIVLMCKVFGVSPDYLILGNGDIYAGSSPGIEKRLAALEHQLMSVKVEAVRKVEKKKVRRV